MNDFEKVLTATAGIAAIAGLLAKVKNSVADCAVCVDVKPKEYDTLVGADYSYGAAISAIYESDMLTTSKTLMTDKVHSGGSADYYKAVISVIKNYRYCSEALSALDIINKSFGFKDNN